MMYNTWSTCRTPTAKPRQTFTGAHKEPENLQGAFHKKVEINNKLKRSKIDR